MPSDFDSTRRHLLLAAGAAGVSALSIRSAPADGGDPVSKVYRIGVISAAIRGQPQKTNGHTFHFCHPLHPNIDLDAIQKHLDPGTAKLFRSHFRNPRRNFDLSPFPDTIVSHYYSPDAAEREAFCRAYVGAKPVEKVEQMLEEVDALWLGDASGYGDDHFDLLAPGLERGLPTFCDKPIGETVAGTRKILDFARQHNAPLMSSSLFRHQWGTEEAVRLRDEGELGPIHYVIASMMGGYSPQGWFVYGQHPVWMAMTLPGPGIQSVSLYARENTAHALLTYPDRMPSEIWYGRPDVREYSHTAVHFQKEVYAWTPSIQNSYWYGHSYQIIRMCDVFRRMVRTRTEPIPHQEILEVTAILHAGAKSLAEKSRLVDLAEVLAS